MCFGDLGSFKSKMTSTWILIKVPFSRRKYIHTVFILSVSFFFFECFFSTSSLSQNVSITKSSSLFSTSFESSAQRLFSLNWKQVDTEGIKIVPWPHYWEIQTFPSAERAKQQKAWVIIQMRLRWHYHVWNMAFVTWKIREANPDFTRKYQFGIFYYSLRNINYPWLLKDFFWCL